MQIVSVRNRPVGVSRTRFGASLNAVERGYFPVSTTGFWSMSGFGANRPDPLSIKSEYLESLAEKEDRERKALLVNLHRAVNPERGRQENFIHVSLYVDRAINDGFFAPEHERAPLWQAAHRLLCLVEADPRFQPVPDNHAWNREQCDKALAHMRTLHASLKRFAQGDYSGEVPWLFFGAKAYLRLPPKPMGEPTIALHETTIELSFNLKTAENAAPRPPRTFAPPVKPAQATVPPSTQLGLFPRDEASPGNTPRISL